MKIIVEMVKLLEIVMKFGKNIVEMIAKSWKMLKILLKKSTFSETTLKIRKKV